MNNIISQDFWCVTLSKDNRECVWQHNEDEISHHLMIEQVVLGLNCKERCMVEATSNLIDGTERNTMICQLIPGAVPNCKLSLSFKQVKLRLAAGDGPVYLTGTHSQEIEDMEEDSDDEGVEAPQLVENEAAEEDEEDDEEEDSSGDEEIDEDKMLEELAAAQANKLKTFMKKNKKDIVESKPGPLSKKTEPKKAEPEPAPQPVEEESAPEPVEEESAEEESAEEEAAEEEAAVSKEEPMEEVDTPAVAAEKSVEMEDEEESDDEEESGEEDDDEEEDEDEDDEDDDDEEVESDDDDEEEEEDDDEEEDESEEESEEEAAPVHKKRKTEAPEPVAVKNKPNGKPAATPKQSKKPQTPSKPNMNDLKKKLLASPSLPKKYEKFVNLMKNAHKITDDKEIKNTWEFLQKNKK